MTEPVPELDSVLQQIDPQWDAARSERTLPGARHKRVQRRRRAWTVASVAALCVGAVAGWQWSAAGPVAKAPSAQHEPGWRTLAFPDGSVAYLHEPETQLAVTQLGAELIEIELAAGRARFEVVKRPQRRFRVRAGAATVQVLGTAFEVVREAHGTNVLVTRGRVAVSWPGGALELGAGQQQFVPLAVASAAPSEEAEIPAAGTRSSAARRADQERAGGKRERASSWRQHAEQGDFSRAYNLLQEQPAAVADDVEELLLAADAARLSGHPAQSLGFLRKVVDKHSADPRAPLAAFTLGGVLLNQLGHPREAQSAYARARALSPAGSLAQDALAREVEAAHRAGDPARARTLALEYLERHPDGRRVQAVRRFGGL